ncbi:response regulator [bacterium]|nr:response regulator [bacterium]
MAEQVANIRDSGPVRARILVVDDDFNARTQIEETLRNADFDVVSAVDGLKAIKLSEAHDFDLVLLDIVMDKMDGFKVCQFLRAKKGFTAPIIFLSTRTNLQDILMGFKLGADDYITKPFVPEALLARIEVGLRLKSYQDSLRNRQIELEIRNKELSDSKFALEQRLIEMNTMFETFSAIHASLDPKEISRNAVQSIMGYKGIEFVLVLSRDHEKESFLVPIQYRGLEHFIPNDFWFSCDDEFIKYLGTKHGIIPFNDLPEQFKSIPNLQLLHSYKPALFMPLKSDQSMHGLLILGQKITGKSFNPEDLNFLELMGIELSGALKKSEFYLDSINKTDQLEQIYLDTLRVLVNAIEARDSYTIGHNWRVSRFAQTLALELNWDETKLKQIEIGGLLHDIGKIGVPDSILRKPEPLTDDEYDRMCDHPELGVRILSNIGILKPFLPYILFHQERYDGTGYPMQLKGKEIPAEGRILAIADAFDAMTSDRPYRKSLSPSQAIAEIERLKGTQFDPEMASIFIHIFHEGKLDPFLQKKDKTKDGLTCPICQTSLAFKDLLLKETNYICPICKHILEVTL